MEFQDVLRVLFELGFTPFNLAMLYIIQLGIGELRAFRETQEKILWEVLDAKRESTPLI